MNKTPPPKPPPETTDVREPLDAALDKPVTNRALFLATAYLAQAIAVEGALTRGDIESAQQQGED
jgi:hypothetical protein